jgi:TRAP-type C4-dicarboxylate transport system permease small subunit
MQTRDRPGDLVERVLGSVSTLLSTAASVAVIFMMVQITADVLLKTLLHEPIVATTEIISAYYMPAAIFLPLAAVEARRRHIMVTLFTQSLNPRAIAGFDAFAGLIGVLYAGCLTWSSAATAVLHTAQRESWDATFFDLAVWPARWFLPVGAGCLALYMLLHVVTDLWVALGKMRAEPRPGGVGAGIE